MAKHQVNLIFQGYDRAIKEIAGIKRLFGSAFVTIVGAFGVTQQIRQAMKDYSYGGAHCRKMRKNNI